MPLLEGPGAVHLDRDVHRALRRLGREELGHRRRFADRADARVVLARRVADEEPRGLDLCRDVGELVAYRLEARAACRTPRALPCTDGRVESGLGHPDAECADARPEEVECVHGDGKAAADLAQHLIGGGLDAVEVEAADRVRRDQLEVLAREALALARDRERGDALGALVRGAREDGVDVRLRRVRDPELRACEAEAVAVLFRPELQRGRVGARVGLAERERRDGVARGEPGIQSSRSSGFAARRIGYPPRPWSASAVSASVQPCASPSRSWQSSWADPAKTSSRPFVGQRLYERPVQPAGLALFRDCREALVAEPARLLEEVSHPAAPRRPSARPSRRAP